MEKQNSRALSTIERLQASRRQTLTQFFPDSLKGKTLVSYISKSGAAINKNLSVDLFDTIYQVKEIQGSIHAIGYVGVYPTFLIFKNK